MAELPLNLGACEWVERNQGRPLLDIEKELVTILVAALRTGPWNVAKSWHNLRAFGAGARMSIDGRLSSADSDCLTRLVFAAHDRCCRVEVLPAGPRGLEVRCWKRERDGSLGRRHPTLEQAVEAWREVPHA